MFQQEDKEAVRGPNAAVKDASQYTRASSRHKRGEVGRQVGTEGIDNRANPINVCLKADNFSTRHQKIMSFHG